MHYRLSAPLAAVLLLTLTRSARAEGTPASVVTETPEDPPAHVFKGRALYLGLGAGVLPDIGVPTENFRFMATIPVASWAMIELFPYGYHFAPTTHHGVEGVTAAGIGAGFRVAPWPTAIVRPHLAARFSHIHLWPDPWGEHEGTGNDSYSHTSHHRWAGAFAIGLDAPLGSRASRFRIGFDLETTLASGPGTNIGIAGLGTIGYAL